MLHSVSASYLWDSIASRTGRYLFYRSLGVADPDYLSLSAGYSASVWWPSRKNPWPSGLSGLRMRARFAFRCLLDCAHRFANREVGAMCIYYGDRLVHYSGFTPRYWRFPFVSDDDLQIGDTWTEPTHRGKGLAGYALQEIVAMKRKRGRGFWYVVGDTNIASIRVAERANFELMGVGDWHKPWGIKLLGSYLMKEANGELSPGVPSSANLGAEAISFGTPHVSMRDPSLSAGVTPTLWE